MIVDTMVFAYALMDVTEFHGESLAILNADIDIVVPDSFRAELINAVWQWITFESVPLQIGIDVLNDVERLVTESIPTEQLWERALVLAVEANHSPYDTLFVAAAESVDSQVITYDARLQSAFPDIAISPSTFLS